MAYTPHMYVAFCGVWTGTDSGTEVWQFGVRIDTGTPAGHIHPNPQAYADALGVKMQTWWPLASSMMSNQAKLTTIKANNINADGTYKDTDSHQYAMSPQPVGGNAMTMPGFVSLAWSWTTDRGRKTGGHGRIYPPNAISPITGSFTIATIDRNLHLTAAKSLLTQMASVQIGGVGVSPVVCSRKDGAIGTIQGVRVDGLYDVQRRRKNRATKVVSSSNWP